MACRLRSRRAAAGTARARAAGEAGSKEASRARRRVDRRRQANGCQSPASRAQDSSKTSAPTASAAGRSGRSRCGRAAGWSSAGCVRPSSAAAGSADDPRPVVANSTSPAGRSSSLTGDAEGGTVDVRQPPRQADGREAGTCDVVLAQSIRHSGPQVSRCGTPRSTDLTGRVEGRPDGRRRHGGGLESPPTGGAGGVVGTASPSTRRAPDLGVRAPSGSRRASTPGSPGVGVVVLRPGSGRRPGDVHRPDHDGGHDRDDQVEAGRLVDGLGCQQRQAPPVCFWVGDAAPYANQVPQDRPPSPRAPPTGAASGCRGR